MSFPMDIKVLKMRVAPLFAAFQFGSKIWKNIFIPKSFELQATWTPLPSRNPMVSLGGNPFPANVPPQEGRAHGMVENLLKNWGTKAISPIDNAC